MYKILFDDFLKPSVSQPTLMRPLAFFQSRKDYENIVNFS